MSLPLWGSLQKSQDDSETIEEAIERLIEAHHDDAEAHQGEGRAIEAHKNEDVIDHPPNSIVEDKIPDRSVRAEKMSDKEISFVNNYMPISEGSNINFFRDVHFTPLTVVGNWTSEIFHSSANAIEDDGDDALLILTMGGGASGSAVRFERWPRFLINVTLFPEFDNDVFMVAGDLNDGFGFVKRGNQLNVYTAKDGSSSEAGISTVPGGGRTYLLEIIMHSDIEEVEVWLDGQLMGFLDTNIPDSSRSSSVNRWFTKQITNDSGNMVQTIFHHFRMSQDLPF